MKRVVALILVIALSVTTLNLQKNVYANEGKNVYKDGKIEVTFDIVSQWSEAYNANVTIKNIGNEVIQNWCILFQLQEEIDSIWNAEIQGKNKQGYVVKNCEWNQDIQKGESVQFGFTAKGDFTDYPLKYNLLGEVLEVKLDNVDVKYSVDSDWQEGFNGNISITNRKDKDIEDWAIEFDYNNDITSIWNAELVSHDGNHYIISSPKASQNIKAGETVEFGFSVNKGSSDRMISNVKITEYNVGIKNNISDSKIELSTNKKEVSSKDTCVIFNAKIKTVEKQLYIVDIEDNTVITELKDSGNFEADGDDIQGDGVWSAKCYIKCSDLRCKEKSYAVVDSSVTTIKSNSVKIKILPSISDDELDNMNYVSKKIKEIFSEYGSKKNVMNHEYIQNGKNDLYGQGNKQLKNKIDELLQEVKNEERIKDYSYDKVNGTYSFHYNNGVNSFISLVDWFWGEDSTVEYNPNMDSNFDGYTAVILNAFENTDYRRKFYEEVIANWRDKGMIVDYDDDVTVNDMKTKMAYKDIISLSGHGTRSGDTSLFCLSDDVVTEDKTSEYMDDILGGRVSILHSSEDIYCVSSEFFDYYYGTSRLNGSFVFSEACEFMGAQEEGTDILDFSKAEVDEDMTNSLLNCGAECVVGFFNSVMADYSRELMIYYFEELLNGKNASEALKSAEEEYGKNDYEYRKPSFLEYLFDSDAYEKMGFIAFPILVGNQDATLVKNIFSEDWESSLQKICSAPVKWKYTGDVRILSNLGEITSKGERMAFISTGVGSKEGDEIEVSSDAQGSTLYQIVRNTNCNSIEFEYDFVSEEPMEYFDSMYNDTFEVQILDMDNNILSSTILESVNNADWKLIGGINFDGGDDTVYHTGWSNVSIDISEYHNKTIKIRFLVYDVGDSQFDSAVLIDNIVCK